MGFMGFMGFVVIYGIGWDLLGFIGYMGFICDLWNSSGIYMGFIWDSVDLWDLRHFYQ